MNDIFITAIEVKKVRNIENFTIPLSETERKHLIITGKNGSGKTSLLNEVNTFLTASTLYKYDNITHWRNQLKGFIQSSEPLANILKRLGGTWIFFKNQNEVKSYFDVGNFILTTFESKRLVAPTIPQGIHKVNLSKTHKPDDEKINKNFIQYIVNLKAERSFAKDDNDNAAVEKIDAWFIKFETQLKELFDAPDLQLIFDRKNYNFHIQIGNNEPFTLAQLSDGYSSVLTIVTELILRMEATGNKAYDLQGVVLIDEIETHLHVALQKKIMPFLCAFFPNIQFIVTTHSPFVLSSISNAVICDLERKEVVTDLSGYSYDALIESYFDTDKYSEEIKAKLRTFEFLSEKIELTEEEQDEYYTLKNYFANLPKFHADELAVKLQQIQLKRLNNKG
jgi:predicted ATP-binding protein involved in virulence